MTAHQAIRLADSMAASTGRPAYIVLDAGALSVSQKWCDGVIEVVRPPINPTNGLY